MVLVKLDRGAKPRQAVNTHEKKCMNCGAVLLEPTGGIDARRFCSNDCKDAYLGTK